MPSKHSEHSIKQAKSWRVIENAFKGRCLYCGKSGNNTLDRMIPYSKGGTAILWNKVPACNKCNQSKGNLNVQEFLELNDVSLRSVQIRWLKAASKIGGWSAKQLSRAKPHLGKALEWANHAEEVRDQELEQVLETLGLSMRRP